jgi:hypothetical protein
MILADTRFQSVLRLCRRIAFFVAPSILLPSMGLASDNAMGCVQEFVIPSSYSTIYMLLPTTVEVQVHIGAHGKAQAVTYDPPIDALKIHLDGYFKEKTRYRDACRGQTIKFTLRYVLADPALDFAVSEVRFDPPDRFLIVCHRLKPSLDPVRESLDPAREKK